MLFRTTSYLKLEPPRVFFTLLSANAKGALDLAKMQEGTKQQEQVAKIKVRYRQCSEHFPHYYLWP